MRILLFSFLIFYTLMPLDAKVLAVVGNKQITQDDVDEFRKNSQIIIPGAAQFEDSHFLNIIINYELAIYDAKKSGLDATKDGREAMDKGLYNYYIYKMADSKLIDKNFSNEELQKFYNKDPLIKFNRLCIPYDIKDADNSGKAKAKLSFIRSEIKSRRISFDKAVKEEGNNSLSSFNGVFDKIYQGQLNDVESSLLGKMKTGEISPILDANGFVEIIQLVKVYPFNSVSLKELNTKMRLYVLEKTKEKLNRSLRSKYKGILKISE